MNCFLVCRAPVASALNRSCFALGSSAVPPAHRPFVLRLECNIRATLQPRCGKAQGGRPAVYKVPARESMLAPPQTQTNLSWHLMLDPGRAAASILAECARGHPGALEAGLSP